MARGAAKNAVTAAAPLSIAALAAEKHREEKNQYEGTVRSAFVNALVDGIVDFLMQTTAWNHRTEDFYLLGFSDVHLPIIELLGGQYLSFISTHLGISTGYGMAIGKADTLPP
jgi:hypothetical protein